MKVSNFQANLKYSFLSSEFNWNQTNAIENLVCTQNLAHLRITNLLKTVGALTPHKQQ